MNAGQGEDFVGQIKNWFNNCPLFTKGIIYICATVGVLDILTLFSYLLMNMPQAVVEGFQVHRLFTSPFASGGILQLLFGFLAFLPRCARQEFEWGTVKTISDFIWKNLLVNIGYIIFAYLLYPLTNYFATETYCYGLWQMVFCVIVESCLQNPEGVSMLLCLPIQIKNKFYPIVLWALFSVISGQPRVDNLIAMGVGYLHARFLNNWHSAFFNSQRMTAWSDTFVFAWLKKFSNYVTAAGGAPVNNRSSTPGPVIGRVDNQSSNTQPQSAQFNAFGGKGVAIGGEDEENPPKKPEAYVQLNDVSDLDASDHKEQGDQSHA